MSSHWDVYVRSGSNGEVAVERARADNPDDAIYQVRCGHRYIPEAGDVVIRCIEVDRPQPEEQK